MKTFSATLSADEWTEILQGGDALFFDIGSAVSVDITLTETASTPADSADCNQVQSWPNGWDFAATGLSSGVQRIWVRGGTTITGVRR